MTMFGDRGRGPQGRGFAPPRRDEEPGERGPEVELYHSNRGPDEALKVRKCAFNGKAYVDVRRFFRGSDGTWRPTQKGLSIRVRELGEVAAALEKAMDLIAKEDDGL